MSTRDVTRELAIAAKDLLDAISGSDSYTGFGYSGPMTAWLLNIDTPAIAKLREAVRRYELLASEEES